MKKRMIGIVAVCAVLVCLAVALSCGGGGGSNAVFPISYCAKPTVDVNGFWEVTDTEGDNTCNETRAPLVYTMTLVQDGSSVTGMDSMTNSIFTGKVCGHTLTLKGSIPIDNGINTSTATVSVVGTTMGGSSKWTWTDGSTNCGGTNTLTAVKDGALAVVNNYTSAITQVYLVPAGAATWGSNQLTTQIDPSATWTLYAVSPGDYDFRAVASDTTAWESTSPISIVSGQTYTVPLN